MTSSIDPGELYEIARIHSDGVETGAIYAGAVPCPADALLAELRGNRVTLRRSDGAGRAGRVELSGSEVMALAAACAVWDQVRDGFVDTRIRAKGNRYGGMLVEPADHRTIIARRPIPARTVEDEVMLVAELRILPGNDHEGELAGAVYAMLGGCLLEARCRRALFARDSSQIELRPEDAPFLSALARTVERAAAALAATPQPEASTRKPASELTEEEIAEAFRI